MIRWAIAVPAALVLSVSVNATRQPPTPVPTSARTPAPAHPVQKVPGVSPAPIVQVTDAHTALVKQHCVVCHSDRGKAGGLTLASFDPAWLLEHPEVGEKMIKKLRLDMMPPPGAKRPEGAVLAQFATALETSIDLAAAQAPNPGHRLFPRLTRGEYARSVRELLDVDVDVNAFLPPDTMSGGFDNVADVQMFSPMLQEGYLRAAANLMSLALGDRNASATEATYKIPRTVNQVRHIDGTPWGTRGGIALTHIFAADGDYTFRVLLYGTTSGTIFGEMYSRNEQLEISVDGERVALFDIDFHMHESRDGLTLKTPPVHIKSGPREVTAAFIQKFDGVNTDLPQPIDYTLADAEYGRDVGIAALPHLRDFSITGPIRVTGVSDNTPSRRKILICRPASAAEQVPCARRIVSRLATEAYRRPVNETDVADLMRFYDQGRKGKDFEAGIKMALQAVLVSPDFLFRVEDLPAGVKPGQNYRVSDLALASRLSYFLWSRPPDEELVNAATRGTLHTPVVLEKQVRRMLADPRAEALASSFGAEFLRLQDVDKIQPDGLLFPSFDAELAASYKRETQLLIENILREDRNVLDLLTADYTFVNERIARVYGIPNITGPEFRRVKLTDPNRRGILGHGSILMETSVAERTSPVLRGKWIMETLLGSPPPPPPPNVPPLENTESTAAGKTLSVRERMEQHRKNPACNSCHRFIDPLGLSLEGFDVTGAERIKDNGVPVDTAAKLWDGTELTGPPSLVPALLRYKEPVLRNFTEHLLAYALGRRAEFYDQPTIRAIVKQAAGNGNRFSSIILGVVKSPAFQMMKAEPLVTANTQPAGPAIGPGRQ